MHEVLDKCTVAKERVKWVICDDVLKEALALFREGTRHFDLDFLTYETEFSIIDVCFARKILKEFRFLITHRFIIYNEGFFNEKVHELMDTLLVDYLMVVGEASSSRKMPARWLFITEEFTRKCCPQVEVEVSRTEDSSRRLLERVREQVIREDFSGNVTVYDEVCFKNCSMRELVVEFLDDHIVLASVYDTLSESRGIQKAATLPCSFNYLQLPPAEALVFNELELMLLKHKIVLHEQSMKQQHQSKYSEERSQAVEQWLRQMQQEAMLHQQQENALRQQTAFYISHLQQNG